MRVEEVNPYAEGEEKGKQVEEMFDSIAWRYDLMNTAMSLGQHKIWRNKALKAALKLLPSSTQYRFLDVATGTGDVAFSLHDQRPEALITGIDLSEGMLQIARKKLGQMSATSREKIAFGKGDSLSLPFHEEEFQLVTVAYGVRNFSNLKKGLEEMRRVLQPGGVLCIIELSTPQGKFSGIAYNIYSGKVIPWVGKKVTGDDRAYSYLPESIKACPQREEMAALIKESGFKHIEWKSLSFGAVTYYLAR